MSDMGQQSTQINIIALKISTAYMTTKRDPERQFAKCRVSGGTYIHYYTINFQSPGFR
jgi:hypothetical protein